MMEMALEFEMCMAKRLFFLLRLEDYGIWRSYYSFREKDVSLYHC